MIYKSSNFQIPLLWATPSPSLSHEDNLEDPTEPLPVGGQVSGLPSQELGAGHSISQPMAGLYLTVSNGPASTWGLL